MSNKNLRKLWAEVIRIFENAYSLLPETIENNEEYPNAKKNYQQFLEANELELALDELEGIGEVNNCIVDFWILLSQAASKMELEEHSKRYKEWVSKY